MSGRGIVGLAFIWCDPKDLHEAYIRRKGKEKEKAYKEIDDEDEDEDEDDEDADEEEEEKGEDLEQAQKGAGPSLRKGRKTQFSNGWVDRLPTCPVQQICPGEIGRRGLLSFGLYSLSQSTKPW